MPPVDGITAVHRPDASPARHKMPRADGIIAVHRPDASPARHNKPLAEGITAVRACGESRRGTRGRRTSVGRRCGRGGQGVWMRLGDSDLDITPIGYGSWAIGGPEWEY